MILLLFLYLLPTIRKTARRIGNIGTCVRGMSYDIFLLPLWLVGIQIRPLGH